MKLHVAPTIKTPFMHRSWMTAVFCFLLNDAPKTCIGSCCVYIYIFFSCTGSVYSNSNRYFTMVQLVLVLVIVLCVHMYVLVLVFSTIFMDM